MLLPAAAPAASMLPVRNFRRFRGYSDGFLTASWRPPLVLAEPSFPRMNRALGTSHLFRRRDRRTRVQFAAVADPPLGELMVASGMTRQAPRPTLAIRAPFLKRAEGLARDEVSYRVSTY